MKSERHLNKYVCLVSHKASETFDMLFVVWMTFKLSFKLDKLTIPYFLTFTVLVSLLIYISGCHKNNRQY